jgi:hypothetical protein
MFKIGHANLKMGIWYSHPSESQKAIKLVQKVKEKSKIKSVNQR